MPEMANAPAFQDMVKFETNFLVPVYVSVTQTCPRSVIDFLVTPSNYSKKKKTLLVHQVKYNKPIII